MQTVSLYLTNDFKYTIVRRFISTNVKDNKYTNVRCIKSVKSYVQTPTQFVEYFFTIHSTQLKSKFIYQTI